MKTAFVLKEFRFDVEKLERILGDLREVKTPFELTKLKRAIEISAIGQVEVMKALHPGMSEREVQGIHEYVFKKYGAAYEGYPSIVGTGNNACVLHYIENSDQAAETDLMLMDLGAEYDGYTADVTRTLPVKGTFTEAQRQLYEIVYDAQEAGIKKSIVGARTADITKITQEVVAKGLLDLGIIEEEAQFRKYYPHGAAHHIGLDVHDLSNYGPLPVNSIITVEPGIYIPKDSPCDPKWWGIGIRIEDDILITENGPINLSAGAPRHWEAIEAMMQKDSPLSNYNLPALSN
jgi:Xaa-Pro aminopeptidase